jgi:hypothetical protein
VRDLDELARWIQEIDDPLLAAQAANLALRVYGKGPRRKPVIEPMSQYARDPIGFMVREIGVPEEHLRWSLFAEYSDHRWDGTPDPLARIAGALNDGQDVGVESGTGTGKTYFAALLTQWFLCAFEDALVVTLAPKEDQLLLNLWKEIGRGWDRFRELPAARAATLLVGKIRMRGGIDESWIAKAFVAGVSADEEVAQAAKGLHARHMLFIFEETPGVPRQIMEAVENTCTGEHNLRLALGNPDNQHDELHRFCEQPGVVAVRMSGYDHPNVVLDREVIPGAITRKSIARRLAKYRSPDARLFLSQVRGISPEEASDALIRRSWVLAAMERYEDPAYRVGPPALGVDVANSEDGDKGALARGKGRCLLELDAFPCPDANLLGVRVALAMALHGIHESYVGVDDAGIGAATYNKLKELGKLVHGLNGAYKPWATVDEERRQETGVSLVGMERFHILRDQMWWQMRLDLEAGRIALRYDLDLIEELTALKWELKLGEIRVTPKDEIRALLGRSPDKGDATVFWNFVRRREPVVAEEKEMQAWSEKALAAELEMRRVRDRAPVRTVDPMVMVNVDE